MKNNEKIYSFLNPDGNDELLLLDYKDQEELIKLLNLFMLVYRDKLNLRKNITFGTEIEFEVPLKKRYDIQEVVHDELEEKYNSWDIKQDFSKDEKLEVVPYILRDTKKTWIELKEVLNIIRKYTKKAGLDASSHIHFGSQILKNNDSLERFYKLWCIYEPIIFRFAYGEDLTHRRKIDDYAKMISRIIAMCNNEVYLEILNVSRNRAINIQNFTPTRGFKFDNTIEIRCPNGTLEPVIWQNNINFFARLLELSNIDKYDDKIDAIFYSKDLLSVNYKTCDAIYLEDALMLSDLIFDNNEDKLYFLRQYTKGFEIVCKGNKKASSFILK